MTSKALADGLRQRQYEKKLVPRWMVDRLKDDEMIDSYVTCSECGAKQAEGIVLRHAIERATGVNDFFRICDGLSNHMHFTE